MITDLREDKNIVKNKPKFDIFKFLFGNKKTILYIFLAIILINIIFNPINTATVLANWINNFIGTFIHTIKI
jgi:hypothetical protein